MVESAGGQLRACAENREGFAGGEVSSRWASRSSNVCANVAVMVKSHRPAEKSAERKDTVEFASKVLRTDPIGTEGRGRERSYAVGELLDIMVLHWAGLPDEVQHFAAKTAVTVAKRPVPLEQLVTRRPPAAF